MIARRGSGWLAPALMLGVCAALAWTVYREIQVGREIQVAAPEPVEAAGASHPDPRRAIIPPPDADTRRDRGGRAASGPYRPAGCAAAGRAGRLDH